MSIKLENLFYVVNRTEERARPFSGRLEIKVGQAERR